MAEFNNQTDAMMIMLKDTKTFRFIDLFAGIGGMRIAFEKSGGRCVFSSEWNKFSQQTYEANFGEVPDGDITKIKAGDIPNHDILVGGFPCQPFSIAGVSSKKALGRKHGFEDETQGTLFFDIVRIIREKKPSGVSSGKRKESERPRQGKHLQGDNEKAAGGAGIRRALQDSGRKQRGTAAPREDIHRGIQEADGL